MRFFKGDSIQNKFTFGITIVISLVMISFSIVTIFYNSRSIEQDLENQLQRLSLFSKNSLGGAIWQYNDDYITEYIDSLFLYEELVFASVVTDSGEIGIKTHSDFLDFSFEDFRDNHNFITKKATVVYKGLNVGEVQLAMTRERVFDLIIVSSALSVFMLLVINVAIFTSILLLNKKYIFTPLAQLEKAVESISLGNLDISIDISGQSEIAKLGRAFYKMMKNLKKITASRDELNHEITERKNAEKQLEKYKNSLEIKVAERTIALKKAQEMVVRKEKLAAIGRLSGSVAHDIRNPLGAIGNSIYYLKETHGNISEEKQIKHLNLMEKEIYKANEIITDLMDFSKENKPIFQKEDMNSFIQTIISDYNFPENITTKLDLQSNLPLPFFDRSQFQRIFLNLIINSIQAMPEGGIFSVSSRATDKYIIIKFQDTGTGISAEDRENIFDALYTTKPKGVGLGLSIVNTFIEKHNARIEVESEINKGSTFTISLPIEIV